MKLAKCNHEKICPYIIKPQTGMWAEVNGVKFWGTECLVYINCPRKEWKKIEWKNNPSAINKISK